ncbi:MAG: SPFH domain-containing protein [Thermoplasmata archaeon]|nr:SPFH domain-containing protein [Thermoplasmata archaeon]
MRFIRENEREADMGLIDGRKTFEWPPEIKAGKLFWRIPRNVQWNDNIIVKEDEYAVFFRDGKALFMFDRPGRYALTTQNVPILAKLGAVALGIRQLGEVFYIQKREIRGKFGTLEPLSFRDKDLGMVRLRAFGQYAFKIVDPLLFITQFVGLMGIESEEEVYNWLRDQIVMVLNDVIGDLKEKRRMGILDMPAYLQDIEALTLARLAPLTGSYGIRITRFAGLNINVPEELKEAIDKRAIMSAYGVDYMTYQTGKAVEGIGKGAEKGGGETSGFTGMGAGLGAGLAMAQSMTQQIGKSAQSGTITCPHCGRVVGAESIYCPFCGKRLRGETIICPSCGHEVEAGARFCPNCGAKLKE